jgi:hypothetical protein
MTRGAEGVYRTVAMGELPCQQEILYDKLQSSEIHQARPLLQCIMARRNYNCT